MTGFTAIDTVIMVAYLLFIVTFGSLFYRGQKDAKDFFLAGRSFGWFPIALSVIASDMSAISYMGCPANAFQKDLRYAVTVLFLPIAVLISANVIVRLLYNRNVFTVYEYLEQRYNIALRFLASFIFLTLRTGWLATAIYTPSLALSVVTGMDLTLCILATGLVATFYATLGGIKAVIWCDVIQFFVLVGGIILSIGFILADARGDLPAIWAIAAAKERTVFLDFDYHLSAQFTVWSLIAFAIVVNMSSYGADQVVVQRYLSARSLRDVIKSAVGLSCLVVPVSTGLYLVGIGLVAYYERHPQMMASLMALDPLHPHQAMDRVFPHFITHALPAGITGLVIAGIIAATMSSVDSGVNSLAAVVVTDYYRRFFHRPAKTEHHYLLAGRAASVAIGVIAATLALFVGQLGTIIEIIGKINGSFAGPLVGIFLLGALTKRANSAGVFLGVTAGLGAVGAVAQFTNVFWAWRAPLGLGVTLIIGYLFSVLWRGMAPKNAPNDPARA